MWPADALKGWHDFYLLVGTAGATLLALLFVAASLGAGFLTQERQGGTRTFMSPVVVHFTTVFFLSAIALVPSHQAKLFAALISVLLFSGCCEVFSVCTSVSVHTAIEPSGQYADRDLNYNASKPALALSRPRTLA